MSKNVVVVGAQWGDEGKGKMVDWLTAGVDGVVRFNGGNNAGHTLVINGKKTVLRLIPSGVMHPGMPCYLGNGVVINPLALFEELETLRAAGCEAFDRIFVSGNATLVMPYHIALDKAREAAAGAKKIGTTGRGIGPAYEDKVARRGVRVSDLFDEAFFAERVKTALDFHNFELTHYLHSEPMDPEKVIDEVLATAPRVRAMTIDVSYTLNTLMDQGKHFLFEGAQGSMLDIDHGTYPFVTSSNTTAGAVTTGAGVGAHRIDRVLGITKAYCTRVGEGPFPTELFDDIGQMIRDRGIEYGAVTGRPRRCGWFDAAAMRRSVQINGLTGLAVMKLDVLDGLETVRLGVGYEYDGKVVDVMPAGAKEVSRCKPVYEDFSGWKEPTFGVTDFDALPASARAFLKRLSEVAGCPIVAISTGPERSQTIMLEPDFFK
ncbi:MAG TPA: adenylosuccinate synthase [Sutterella sp.]|nr:adenylosuccinate synthase [Sutterella sp.]